MQSAHNPILNSYAGLFQGLSFQTKLELMERLLQSMKTDVQDVEQAFYSAFGTFPDTESADDIIAEIKAARAFNRKDIQL